MKTYTNENRSIWYNTHLKLWTMITKDTEGDQIGDADYTNLRRLAFYWLRTGNFTKLIK
jgi:hypothetical protein